MTEKLEKIKLEMDKRISLCYDMFRASETLEKRTWFKSKIDAYESVKQLVRDISNEET